ncbi:hypothetical protein LTR78_009146 [Recurvomyces mirabilis]|uniref:T6SS Phospholipase effector Tle1-like catalytic domain-containing protein n=1 Tax=Recurvomyces mirabilis TaxID=574656 RepID=A0AAE0TSW8_9PEZI|nr:hypothetical protein LTR78_009146 [Recurvomyces mirabilis]KAK5161082.1 hypothetical protein LTS14_000878 [Recurvomyces mirabilis]
MSEGRHGSVAAEEEERMRVKLPKKLIICCDGTWMDSDNGWVPGKWGQPGHLQNPTNVTRLARAIKSEDDHHHPQIVYYQAGIGTGLGLYNHIVGGGTGLGLAENVREAYAFLANNYSEHDGLVPNDSIFLAGFSRGAYTARTLGGFICAMGVLKKEAMSHFYECFEDWEHAGDPHYKPLFFDNYIRHHKDRQTAVDKVKPDPKMSRSKDHTIRDKYIDDYFRALLALGLSQKVTIKAIGVWDTVGALGIPVNPLLHRILPVLPSFFRTYRFFDTKLHNSINNAYHALALDERRFPYSPAIWERQPECTTNLEQVWFPGAHSNIGGSYADPGIADITLAWMMDRLSGNMLEDRSKFEFHDWIQFDDNYLDHWYGCLHSWLTDHPDEALAHQGWARGTLYDSNTFPQSLAGARTRSPGKYHGTFYETGNTDFQHVLADTQEHIHSCVRARLDLGGLAPEPDWSSVFPHGLNLTPLLSHFWRLLRGGKEPLYLPQKRHGPLEEWVLHDNHAYHDEVHGPNNKISMDSGGLEHVQWEYMGKEKVARKVLPEARLGRFEVRLLRHDEQIARGMEFSNNGWRWAERFVNPSRHGRTMPV